MLNEVNLVPTYFLKKRIVITGASSGIGQALSYWYLNQGAFVILVARDEQELRKMALPYPKQATVVVTENISDDFQCKVS
jgi:NADP-dependent 3-hydroxy acid dehydrogenase YdfG